jgi:uncharacterized protein YacL
MDLEKELNKDQFLLIRYGLIITLVIAILIVIMLASFKINQISFLQMLIEYYLG